MKRLLAWSIVLTMVLSIPLTAGAACAHVWDVLGKEEATCLTDGFVSKRCIYCGESRKETIKSTGEHNPVDQYEIESPTCNREGVMRTRCKDCGVLDSYVLPPNGHSWKTVYYKKPTCISRGSLTEECIYCGEQKKMELPSTGTHDWYDIGEIKAATCKKKGSMSIECRDCGKTGTRELKKTDHSYNWSVTVNSSDNSQGTRVGTCSYCNKKLTEKFYPEGTLYRDIENKNAVRLMQEKLIVCGYLTTKADGVFGKDTEQAVKNFQSAEGLKADGIAWPETLKLLHTEYTRSGSTPYFAGGAEERDYGSDTVMSNSGVISTGSVNLRSGPGLDYSIVGMVGKDAHLGKVLDSAVDNRGVVWFMVDYKGEESWVSSVYSKLYAENIDFSADRLPFPANRQHPSEYYMLDGGMELMNYHMCNMDIVCSALYLEAPFKDNDGMNYATNWAMSVNGHKHAEVFVLTDGDYCVYGAKLGMNINEVKNLFSAAGLYYRGEENFDGTWEYSFLRPYQPDSMYVDENGFDVEILVHTNREGVAHTLFIRTLGIDVQ